MNLYPDAKSPGDVEPYTFDWSPALLDGEIVTTAVVAFIDTAGTTQPNAATVTGNVSRVWLAGGNAGSRAVWTVTATTSANPSRTIEEAFAVRIEAATVEENDVTRLTADIATLRAARIKLASGTMVRQVARSGRMLVNATPSLADINAAIRVCEEELATAKAIAAGGTRRRAIPLAWAN